MGEYEFTDNLVSITPSRPTKNASRVLARLESAGIAVTLEEVAAGSEILVRQGDYRRAKEILAELEDNGADVAEPPNDYNTEDYDADDWSGEDWTDDDYGTDEDDEEEYSEEPAETPPAIRAWRAAVIGTLLLPLNLYSWWLILQHELWIPNPSQANPRWRFHLTILFNLLGLLFFWSITRQWL